LKAFKELLRTRDFRLLWSGQVVSNFGDALTSLALLLTAEHLTGSVAAVATTAIAIALPQLFFGLIAGVYVDRWNRKHVMVVSDIIRGVLVLGFLFVTTPGHMWLLYVVAFAQATIGTLFTPARMAILPEIIPEKHLLSANSIAQSSRVIFNLLGTAAAGLIAGLAGSVTPAFIIDSGTFLVSAFLVSHLVAGPAPERAEPSSPLSMWSELTVGLRVLADSRVLKGVLIGGGIVMFGLGAVNVLLVPFVVGILEVPATWFGALEGSQVTSMVLSGALVVVLATKFRPTNLISAGLAGTGLVVASMALAGTVWHLMLALFAVGWFVTPLQASIATLFQSEVEAEKRGRAGSALNTVMTGAQVASMALAGAFAAAVGVRGVFVAAGAIALLASLVTVQLFRGIPLAAMGAVEIGSRASSEPEGTQS